MLKKNLYLTILLLTVFIGTSILALLTAKKVTHIEQPTVSANSPDFFMTNTTYFKFSHEGNIQNQIKADKITHLDNNNTYLFEKPDILMFTPGEQPWHITANKGKSEQGKSTVYLWHNVKIVRKIGPNNPDFDITTSELTVYPDIKFAETDKPVTIIQSGNTTKAVGAKADFKTGIIKLVSKIESWLQIK